MRTDGKSGRISINNIDFFSGGAAPIDAKPVSDLYLVFVLCSDFLLVYPCRAVKWRFYRRSREPVATDVERKRI
jgi:hypothetical protein